MPEALLPLSPAGGAGGKALGRSGHSPAGGCGTPPTARRAGRIRAHPEMERAPSKILSVLTLISSKEIPFPHPRRCTLQLQGLNQKRH